MRLAILSIFLIFLSQTMFAANLQPQPAETMANPAHPPKKTRLPKEKKGTMAFIASAVLGPVGYLGAYALSHDEHVMYRAGRGLRIWTAVVVVTGLVVVGALTKTSIDFSALNFGD
jgi:hypothetical protein